jgi:hypothetical protein
MPVETIGSLTFRMEAIASAAITSIRIAHSLRKVPGQRHAECSTVRSYGVCRLRGGSVLSNRRNEIRFSPIGSIDSSTITTEEISPCRTDIVNRSFDLPNQAIALEASVRKVSR